MVWVAADTVLRRFVLVKVLRPSLAADRRLVDRFRRQAMAAAGLRHPGLLAVYDTVHEVDEDGRGDVVGIVLEHVNGTTLQHELDAHGRLPVDRIVRTGATLAATLDALHAAGLVHGDLRPSNVLLAADGRVLLADLGLARPLRLHPPGRPAVTVLASPHHVAPEQALGRPATPASDLYAFGVVLYRSLAGHEPFGGDTPEARALARLTATPAPIATARHDTPDRLARLVDRLLDPDPARRPTRAAIVRIALERLHTELAIAASSTGTGSSTGEAAGAGGAPALAHPVPDPGEREEAAPVEPGRASWLGAVAVVGGVALAVAGLVIGPRWPSNGPTLRPVEGTERAAAAASTASASASEATAAAGSGSTVTSTSPGGPAEIVSTAEFDPEPGDGRENPARLGHLTDGDAGTSWTTLCYTYRSLAPKLGVGVVLQLSAPAARRTLQIDSALSGWGASVYVADHAVDTLVEWGEPVATGADLGAGRTRFDLGDRTGRYVLVFITEVGPSERCGERYQARIAEIAIGP